MPGLWIAPGKQHAGLVEVLGPVVAGAIWDRWQTYEPMLWGLVAMFFISGIFYRLLGRPWAQPKPA